MSRTIIASPAAHKRQVGFETAVTAVIFAQKLKDAAALSHGRSPTPVGGYRPVHISVRGTAAGDNVPCRAAAADTPLGLVTAVKC